MFSHPYKNIVDSFVAEGMHVADFGAGVGHHALALAERVGEFGEVYAIDVQKDLLSKLAKEAKQRGFENVHLILGDVEKIGGSTLADNLVERVLIINTLFQLEDKKKAMEEAKRILKPKGKLAIIDWQDSYQNMGPHRDHVVKKHAARKLAEEAGFIMQTEMKSGDHHYGMVFRVQKS